MIRLLALAAIGTAAVIEVAKRRKKRDGVILLPPPQPQTEKTNDQVGS
jgi:hypothetical protein